MMEEGVQGGVVVRGKLVQQRLQLSEGVVYPRELWVGEREC